MAEEPLHVVTVLTADYVRRARTFLRSLQVVQNAERWCACLGFDGQALAQTFPHVVFQPLPRHSSESYGMLQHGRWLDALPEIEEQDLCVLSDADVLVQRDFTPEERARFTVYDANTIGAGCNRGLADNLWEESQRIRMAVGNRYADESSLKAASCYNCGLLIARASVWRRLQALYESLYVDFYQRSQDRCRCQWLLCWCMRELGLCVDALPGSLHTHGHFGRPPGVTFGEAGIAYHEGQLVMFRHALPEDRR